eukprot:SM001604S02233  [mRNA]  locus=s1604:1450:2003:- [translate_table: standard]
MPKSLNSQPIPRPILRRRRRCLTWAWRDSQDERHGVAYGVFHADGKPTTGVAERIGKCNRRGGGRGGPGGAAGGGGLQGLTSQAPPVPGGFANLRPCPKPGALAIACNRGPEDSELNEKLSSAAHIRASHTPRLGDGVQLRAAAGCGLATLRLLPSPVPSPSPCFAERRHAQQPLRPVAR